MKLYSAVYETGGHFFKDIPASDLFMKIPGGSTKVSNSSEGELRFKLPNGRKITIYEETAINQSTLKL